MFIPCPGRCGSKIDPDALPGGLCRTCFSDQDTETQQRLRAEFRDAQNKRLNPVQPRWRPPKRPTDAAYQRAKPNRSTNRDSRRGGRAA